MGKGSLILPQESLDLLALVGAFCEGSIDFVEDEKDLAGCIDLIGGGRG